MPLANVDYVHADGAVTRYNRRGSGHTISALDRAGTQAQQKFDVARDPRSTEGFDRDMLFDYRPRKEDARGFVYGNQQLSPEYQAQQRDFRASEEHDWAKQRQGWAADQQTWQQESHEMARKRHEMVMDEFERSKQASALALENQRIGNVRGQQAIDAEERVLREVGAYGNWADQQLGLAGQLDAGVGSGVLRPDVAAGAREFAQSPAGRVRQAGGRMTPEIMREFFQGQDEYGSVAEAAGQFPEEWNVQVSQTRRGKFRAQGQTPRDDDEANVGYDTEEEAMASIRPDERGTARQNKKGRWLLTKTKAPSIMNLQQFQKAQLEALYAAGGDKKKLSPELAGSHADYLKFARQQQQQQQQGQQGQNGQGQKVAAITSGAELDALAPGSLYEFKGVVYRKNEGLKVLEGVNGWMQQQAKGGWK
ncbi:MAG: hypothetical protein LBK99_05715 [Opitutaceae bacterium]|jgi:hypothetical protein|nr:hypothetical protein [Opitutaceae bacterium]